MIFGDFGNKICYNYIIDFYYGESSSISGAGYILAVQPVTSQKELFCKNISQIGTWL